MRGKRSFHKLCVIVTLFFISTSIKVLYEIRHTVFIEEIPQQLYSGDIITTNNTNSINLSSQELHQLQVGTFTKNIVTQYIATNNPSDDNELNKLISMRTHAINEKCINPYRKSNNSHYKRLNISSLPLNMMPFLNRCRMNKSIFTQNHAEWQEMYINSKIGYIHNYKVAGTTIQEGLHNLKKTSKLEGEFVLDQIGDIMRFSKQWLNDSKYYQRIDEWYRVLSDTFLFSLVRDPIDRFLSSYFEINQRDLFLFELLHIEHQTGLQKLRSLLTIFVNNTSKYLLEDNPKLVQMKHLWSGEAHLHPQTIFLLNEQLDYFPFDYIGDLQYFDDIMRSILEEFVPYLIVEPRFYPAALRKYRIRRYKYRNLDKQQFNLNRENLTDADIRMICEIYWIDYICFPFDIPQACNITDLFIKHYGKHVTYNECYYN